MPCYSPLKGWRASDGRFTLRREEGRGEQMEVSCGGCLGCRLDRSRLWAGRIVHESSLYDYQHGNCFVTLTYRDLWECSDHQLKKGHHLPSDGSLHPSHLTKFLKRLRKSVSQKVRYYAVGEYGDKTARPHYHAILFNVDFSDKVEIREEEGVWLYSSEELDRLWPYGFTTVGEANWETAAYCARYVMKKVGGVMADEHYRRWDEELGYDYWIQPEFSRMSLKPGIGAEWFERYKEDFYPRDEFPVPGKGVQRKLPRYYDELFLRTSEMDAHVKAWKLAQVKERRLAHRLENPEEYAPDRLMTKYKVKKAQLGLLRRNL